VTTENTAPQAAQHSTKITRTLRMMKMMVSGVLEAAVKWYPDVDLSVESSRVGSSDARLPFHSNQSQEAG
jgi:hypothetical protein